MPMEVVTEASLQGLNTFGVPCVARTLVHCATKGAVHEAVSEYGDRSPLVLGGGSNILFRGPRYDGIVLRCELRGVSFEKAADGTTLVRAAAGEPFDEVVRLSVERGLHGLENLSGIPGTVGAAPVQNVGAYGAEAGDCLELVEGLDIRSGQAFHLGRKECRFGYRSSVFKGMLRGDCIIMSVTWRLTDSAPWRLDYGPLRSAVEALGEVSLSHVREAVLALRASKLPDPSQMGNAGSFFKNPEVPAAVAAPLMERWPDMPHYPSSDGLVKIPAAWLIERAGWKGRRLGPAGVYDKHPLVLVNLGGATGADIVALSEAIVADVERLSGIRLSPEVNVIG